MTIHFALMKWPKSNNVNYIDGKGRAHKHLKWKMENGKWTMATPVKVYLVDFIRSYEYSIDSICSIECIL